MRYLKTRERKSGFLTSAISSPSGKGKGKGGKPTNKRKATSITPRTQRAWGYLQEGQPTSLVAPPPFSKGKGKGGNKGKGEFKGKGKHKSKGKSWSKGQGHSKGMSKGGKGKSKGLNPKGKPLPKGNPFNSAPTDNASSTSVASPALVRCHFCHLVGHKKPNCRKWLALQHSDQYQKRHTHDQRYQLIYDHLEDSVLAPWDCPYCSDPSCDASNCQSTFDHQDFHDASTFFTSTINTLVLNAKLDRPLDSHTPQTTSNYAYEDYDWGEQEPSYDQEPYTQEQEHDVWDAEDQNQEDEDQDEYQVDNEEAECHATHETMHDSDDQDEDDQGNYE